MKFLESEQIASATAGKQWSSTDSTPLLKNRCNQQSFNRPSLNYYLLNEARVSRTSKREASHEI